jgi:cyclic pyranopterin phosphate synthase
VASGLEVPRLAPGRTPGAGRERPTGTVLRCPCGASTATSGGAETCLAHAPVTLARLDPAATWTPIGPLRAAVSMAAGAVTGTMADMESPVVPGPDPVEPARTSERPTEAARIPEGLAADRGDGEVAGTPTDRLGRRVHDLRISVTDRCNFRCVYCMPREVYGRDFPFLPRSEVLTFEEITRIAGVFVDLGVEKLRITGGEPLVRRDLPELIGMLAALGAPDRQPLDLTLTTNGAALRQLARPLADAGLRRITVSLDSLDDETFRRMNGVDFPVDRVLDGIEAARAAGLDPIKVNMVVKRGLNEASVLPMARWARAEGLVLRFIEYMDVGHSNGWRLDEVVPAAELLGMVGEEVALEPLPPRYAGEVADRWRYADGSGEIGVIASVSQPFCGECTRARLSADGQLFTCLFAVKGHDLRAVVRSGADDEALRARIAAVWRGRADRYSELRSEATPDLPKVEMFAIGG